MKKEDRQLRFHYLGKTFSKEDYVYYSNLLKEEGIKISKTDVGGPKASFQDFMLETYIMITNPVTMSILNDIKGNALWDLIKFISQDAYRKMKGQKHYSTRTKETKETSFGLEFKLEENKSIKFQLNNISEKEIANAIYKILKFLNKQNTKELKSNRYFAQYSSGKWKSKDINVEVSKIAMKAMAKQEKEKLKSNNKKKKSRKKNKKPNR